MESTGLDVTALADRKVELPPVGTEEWAFKRRRMLGASEAPCVLGIDPYKTPLQLAREKWGFDVPKEAGEAARWGNILEPVVATELAERTGWYVEPNKTTYHHSQYPWMVATPDAWTILKGNLVPIQIKTTSAYNADKWAEGPADTAHAQVMHELEVLGLPRCVVAVLIGGQKLKWFEVEIDSQISRAILSVEIAFWERVQSRVEPILYPSDTSTFNRIYPAHLPNKRLDLDDASPTLARWFLAKAQLKQAELEQDLAEAEIKQQLQDAEEAKIGKHRVTWRTVMSKGSNTARRFLVQENYYGEE